MMDLAMSSENARIRADVFRNLEGLTDPSMKAPLLNGLAKDPSANVREEAAETLGPFAAQDPNVRQWLEYAAENDSSQGVRNQARRSLSRYVNAQ